MLYEFLASSMHQAGVALAHEEQQTGWRMGLAAVGPCFSWSLGITCMVQIRAQQQTNTHRFRNY